MNARGEGHPNVIENVRSRERFSICDAAVVSKIKDTGVTKLHVVPVHKA